MQLEPIHQLVLRFVGETNRPIFLTGKAGTGKTTFLRYIKANVGKNLAIVAPTAVAAINAGGVTIHSFFQVPFGPQVPASGFLLRQLTQEKDKLLKCLELLIIEEISMVRADTLDYIDAVLRQAKGSSRPFGGVQLLMIGDLYQLPPVYEKDWPILQRFYKGPYFFHSLAFSKFPVLTFELTQVYRQKDPVFVEILNQIRDGFADTDALGKLNAHYHPGITANGLKDYVTLSTHNKLVDEINQLRLSELDGEAYTFKATVTGDFQKEGYPAEDQLMLKLGAQVMFIKNDSTGKKQYYNGRTGRITAISPTSIRLVFLDDETEFDVVPETWNNVKYALAESEQKVSEANNGSFSQYPLRLAWAITIHKSQGLTFDKAVIDIDAAFAFGQAYVALSRCRSLEGMILKSPVRGENIRTDPEIARFMQQADVTPPGEQLLQQALFAMEKEALADVFDFSVLYVGWQQLKPLLEGINVLHLQQAEDSINKEIKAVGDRFMRKELDTLQDDRNVWGDDNFKNRLKQAAAYFVPKVTALATAINGFYIAKKNNEPPAEFYEGLNYLLVNLKAKTAAFIQMPLVSSIAPVLASAQKAGTDYRPLQKNWNPKAVAAEKEIQHPELYQQLLKWRTVASKQRNILEYALVSDNMLIEVTAKLPRTLQDLAALKGFGAAKAKDFGDDVLKIVQSHFGESGLFG